MTTKLIGAVCIFTVCAGSGFAMAYRLVYEEKTMRQLVLALDFMECELQCRLTQLPVLCRKTSRECTGVLAKFFQQLAIQLESQVAPDVKCCVSAVLGQLTELPSSTQAALEQLGISLGRFDLQGQLSGFEAVKKTCIRTLDGLEKSRDIRVKGYKTLGICAGAALVILFI